jgi:DNA-directed RNA polymerase specialized sigma24 family protein
MIAKIEDFEKYIPDLRKLFYYKLKKYHLKDVKSAVDDLMQDFFIELWKQSERCFANEEHYKHFLFLNYKWFCLRIKRNLYFLNKASMPEEVFEIPNKAYEYNINDEIELFKSILTPDECLVLDKRLEGYNQREIALNHNINEIKVHGFVRSIKNKYTKKTNKVKKYTKSIICENGKTYNSLLEAAKDIKGTSAGISMVLNGKRKKYKGFSWKYDV